MFPRRLETQFLHVTIDASQLQETLQASVRKTVAASCAGGIFLYIFRITLHPRSTRL
jgi:hypothetical protein